MIKNKLFGTNPIMAHAPGKLEFIPLWDCLCYMSKRPQFKTNLPDNITLITFNNGREFGHNGKKLGLLEESLDLFGIKYTVLGYGIKEWKNSMKIELIDEFLKKVETQYVLSCDSSDVFLINKFDNICKIFENIGCEALFNAEKNSWPIDLPQEIIKFGNSLNENYFLNAGLWMSTTQFAREITKWCLLNKSTTATK